MRRQPGHPPVHSPIGGRSLRRWQEHERLHNSMKRKLSSTLSETSATGSLLSDPGMRKATATGAPRLHAIYPASQTLSVTAKAVARAAPSSMYCEQSTKLPNRTEAKYPHHS